MARFQDLSVDLLYVIFSYLQTDKGLLQNVALSSRLLRDVSQRFIVRNVTITHNPTLSRSKLFLRTLQERPDLTAHVHRLEIDLLRETVHWPEEVDTIHQVARLLTNLREFSYLSRDYKVWHYELPFPLTWTAEHAHDQVRRIEWDHNMTVEILYKCMQLPQIAHIYCRELHMRDPTVSELPTLPAISSSSVTELRIGCTWRISRPELRHVLQLPRCLRKLTFDFHDQLGTTLEPEHVIWMLEPVRLTLHELTIWGQMSATYNAEPPTTAGHFSALTQLRKLTLPLKFLLGRGMEGILLQNGVIPPQLRELSITFASTVIDRPQYGAYPVSYFTALIRWLGSLQTQREEEFHVRLEHIGYRPNTGDIPQQRFEELEGVLRTLEAWGTGTFRLVHTTNVGMARTRVYTEPV